MIEKRFEGRPAAPGLALGALVAIASGTAAARVASGNKATEAGALRSALAAALGELRGMVEQASGEAAEILGFQVAFLEDDELAAPAFAAIGQGRAAHEAWIEAIEAEAAHYKSSTDEYFRARATDIGDIGERVLGHLTGVAETRVPPGAIVAAVDIAPSRFLAIDWSQGGALVLTAGSATSHVSMLARSRGVPAVVGLGVDLAELTGQALVDASRGVLVVNPGDAARAQFAHDARSAAIGHTAAQAAAKRRCVTADGTPIGILLNISGPEELEGLDPAFCDGIGLVRTELLFHGSRGLPDEERQFDVYRRIAQWAGERPVTIRTLDAGGDKPIAGLTMAGETNPFLGVRGLRLSLARPDVFRAQLRALARAAVHGNVKVMLPMVTLPAELAAARALLDEEVAALRTAGVAARRPSLGIMVEVPAAAIAADLFDAEFFSIGSNDLAQYVAAAGRDVEALAPLADPVQPAMLRLISYVVDSARGLGIEVSLCGDAGGDPRAIPLLLRAGLRRLSMPPRLVGAAKAAIAAIDLRTPGPAAP